MSFYIFDIDNCIADDGWRVPRIRWEESNLNKRYHDYHSLAPFDQSANTIMLPAGIPGTTILFFTARPEHYRVITHEWIHRRLPLDKVDWRVYMRADHDHCGSVELKQGMLEACTSLYSLDPSKVIGCYDDRQDVVDMYRANGFNSQRIWIHTQTVWKESHA